MFETVAIIVAAGQGKRMGANINKQYLYLQDMPVLARTVQRFQQHAAIDGIIIVAKEDEIDLCYQEVVRKYNLAKVIKVISGGKERQDSVYRGLKELPVECNLVVVHDGARPLVTPDIISSAVQCANSYRACIAAVPVKDTIKRVSEVGNVQTTLPRSELWAVQTPQVFQKELILQAYKWAMEKGIYGTDDAALVEKLGEEVKVVMGSYENLKITTPGDITLAEAVLKNRQVEVSATSC